MISKEALKYKKQTDKIWADHNEEHEFMEKYRKCPHCLGPSVRHAFKFRCEKCFLTR